jgi:hypothetical protein
VNKILVPGQFRTIKAVQQMPQSYLLRRFPVNLGIPRGIHRGEYGVEPSTMVRMRISTAAEVLVYLGNRL